MPECGAWNSFVEEARRRSPPRRRRPRRTGTRRASATGRASLRRDRGQRRPSGSRSGIDEFDRVLGGGIVPGFAGPARRRTRHRQVDAAAPDGGARGARHGGPVLYSSGEESEHQVKSRGERLGVGRAPLYLLAETCLERVLEEMARLRPGARRRRLDSDRVLPQDAVGARQHRPGARGGHAAALRGQVAERAGVPRRATSRRRAAWPAPRRSSTSSTRCCTSRASATTRIASCARPRTGSAPSASSGVFEMTGRRTAGRREPVGAVPGRAARREPRVGRGVLHGGHAADPGRGAGPRQHDHLRLRPADRRGDRPEPAVAAAGRARETRRACSSAATTCSSIWRAG